MFGIPGKQAVSMTPAAVRQITRLMVRDGRAGLRIGVKKGGCAGMEYTMDFADEIGESDEVVEQDGARVMIADACGCGESIKFKDVEELSSEFPGGVPKLS